MRARLLDSLRVVLQIATLVVWARVFAAWSEPLTTPQAAALGTAPATSTRPLAAPPRRPP